MSRGYGARPTQALPAITSVIANNDALIRAGGLVLGVKDENESLRSDFHSMQ